jgi:hypothetical protein
MKQSKLLATLGWSKSINQPPVNLRFHGHSSLDPDASFASRRTTACWADNELPDPIMSIVASNTQLIFVMGFSP